MGIDACIDLKLAPNVSLEELGYQLRHRFRRILTSRESELAHKWALIEPAGEYKLHEESTHRLGIQVRYYGPQYERGPGLEIYGLLRYLMQAPEVLKAWYAGDYGTEVEEVTARFCADLLAHWLDNGRFSYIGFFDRERDGPMCCGHQMLRWGWGGNYKAWRCSGCDGSIEERNGVQSPIKWSAE